MSRQTWLGRILKVADAHYGLLCTDTAALAHITPYQLAAAARVGLIERVLPRVYRVVGMQQTRQQEILAAQMWGAPECAISHWTAAELHELDLAPRREIHLTTTRHVESPAPSLIVHSRAFLRSTDICTLQGIPTTEPMRTLIDLAADSKPHVWESALDAFVRRGLDLDQFVERFEATAIQGRTGTRLIRETLQARAEEAGVPEELFERRFLNLLRERGIELPVAQFWLTLPSGRSVRLDFAYPQQRVAIEAQSYEWHSSRLAWERDRARTSDLTSLGWRVLEITWRQLDSPDGVAALVRRTLARAAG